jgi:hypothetical protein
MSNEVKNLHENGVDIEFNDDTLYISGSIDNRNPGKFLNPYFSKLHEEIVNSGKKEVKVDLTKLTFLNSSGIKEFVEWIMKIDSLQDNRKYNITFLTNSELLWQESSISTLVYLNPMLLKKVVVS